MEDEIVDVPEVGFYYEDLSTSAPHDIYKCVDIGLLDHNPFPYIMVDKNGKAHDFSVFNWKKVEESKDY